MSNNIITIEFAATAQPATPGRFTIPKAICDLLEAAPGDMIAVLVTDRDTLLGLYAGKEQLKSDNEIYSDALKGATTPGEEVIICVSPVMNEAP